MNNFATLLESEMKQAILKQDENAIKRVSLIVAEKIEKVEDIEETQADIRSDIKVIAEVMKKGFEDMNRRFNMIFAFMSLGFTIITGIIVLFKFLR